MLRTHMARCLALAASLPTVAHAGNSMASCMTSQECDVNGNIGEFCVDFAYICMETPAGYVAIADDRSVQPCPAGTYAPLPSNNPECLDCEPGKFQSVEKMSECECIPAGSKAPDRANVQLCSPGTYYPSSCYASSDCLPCDEGKYQSASGETECVCSSKGNTVNVQKDAEEPCPVGTFSGEACGACESCPAGKFAASTGSSACTDASAGHIPDDDAAGEIECPTGSFAAAAGQSECEPCAPGKYADAAGSTTCKDAEAGNHPNAGADGVVACLAGFEQPEAGQVACNACPLGKFSSAPGATECECAPDGSQPTEDNTGTEECPAGSKSSHHAPSGCKMCMECLPGKYSDASGTHGSCTCTDPGHYPAGNSQSQLKCDLGTYSLGCNETCTACGTGSYADESGSSECTEALPGTHAAADAQSVVDCLPGEYQDLPGQATCRKCEKGTYSDAAKSANCTECPAGKYVGSAGATACLEADKGFYVPDAKSSMQRPCTRGQHANESGMAKCELCGNGEFANESGLVDCYVVQPGYMSVRENSAHAVKGFVDQMACVPSYYNPEAGGYCHKCEAGKFAAESGSSECTCAEPGYYGDASRQRQLKCPKGYTAAVDCTAECEKCPSGKTTSKEGSVECDAEATEEETTTEEDWGDLALASVASDACDDQSISSCCPGKYWSKLLLSCERCAPGHFSVSSRTECQECGPGEYQDEFGKSECKTSESCSFYQHAPADECVSCFTSPSYMFGPGICLLPTLLGVFALLLTAGGAYYASGKIIQNPPTSAETQPIA